MSRLIKVLAVILTMVSLTLTGCATVNRPLSQTETYTWGYRYAGATATPVCKKVTVVIPRDRQEGSVVTSTIVPETYCKQAKPIQYDNAS